MRRVDKIFDILICVNTITWFGILIIKVGQDSLLNGRNIQTRHGICRVIATHFTHYRNRVTTVQHADVCPCHFHLKRECAVQFCFVALNNKDTCHVLQVFCLMILLLLL